LVFECRLCFRTIAIDARVDHLLTSHGAFFRRTVDRTLDLLNVDDEPFNIFFVKLQFDSLVSLPTRIFLPRRAIFCSDIDDRRRFRRTTRNLTKSTPIWFFRQRVWFWSSGRSR
jgi:hypothetical protein